MNATTFPPATAALIGITCIVSFLAFRSETLYEKSLFSVSAILSGGEIHRLISSLFIHADWGHLLVNMFSLYSFSRFLEIRYGAATLFILYFGSALFGDLVALAVKRREPGYRAVGASGAVSGVIFASIFLLPGGGIYIFPIPFALPSWLFAFLFVAVSMFGIGRGTGDIGHEAHLGGALGGVLITALLYPTVLTASPLLTLGVVVPAVAFLIAVIIRQKGRP